MLFVVPYHIHRSRRRPIRLVTRRTPPVLFRPLVIQHPAVQTAFSSGSLPDYINNVFTIILSVGAIMAVLRIAYGGYLYMGSADMWGNKQQAKETIGDAIIGLLLLFAVYLILNQINPNLLNLNVKSDITPIQSTTDGTPTNANNGLGTAIH